MNAADVAKSSIVIVVVLLVQHAILDSIRIAGAHPDITVLLPVAAGYVASSDRGAVFGFAAGICADLLVPTPFGLSALIYCLLGYLTGIATASLVRNSWLITSLVFAAASAAGLSAYALLGALLGNPLMLTRDLPPALAITAPVAFLLGAPIAQLVSWAVPQPSSVADASVIR